mgnify:CR=1 FL=1
MTYTLELLEQHNQFMQAVTSQAYELAAESGKVSIGQIQQICIENRDLIGADDLRKAINHDIIQKQYVDRTVEILEDAVIDIMHMNDKLATPILDRLTKTEGAEAFMDSITV